MYCWIYPKGWAGYFYRMTKEYFILVEQDIFNRIIIKYLILVKQDISVGYVYNNYRIFPTGWAEAGRCSPPPPCAGQSRPGTDKSHLKDSKWKQLLSKLWKYYYKDSKCKTIVVQTLKILLWSRLEVAASRKCDWSCRGRSRWTPQGRSWTTARVKLE